MIGHTLLQCWDCSARFFVKTDERLFVHAPGTCGGDRYKLLELRVCYGMSCYICEGITQP